MKRILIAPVDLFAILSACTLLVCTSTGNAMPPQHVEITFEIKYGAMKLGEGRDVLVHDGKHYDVVSKTIPKGIAAVFIKDIQRQSSGAITETGLRPDRFREQGRKKGVRGADFNWTESTLRLVNGETITTVPLPQNTIDQASLPYGFAFVGKMPDVFSAHVTDGRRLRDYRYRIIGHERISTVLGDINTIHVEKVRAPDDKRGFDFWLSVDHHYLPVKMRFTEKGRTFDSIVTAIKYH